MVYSTIAKGLYAVRVSGAVCKVLPVQQLVLYGVGGTFSMSKNVVQVANVA